MATQQVGRTSPRTPRVSTIPATPSYPSPLAIVSVLFFIWGFLTCRNDILVQHLNSILDLGYALKQTRAVVRFGSAIASTHNGNSLYKIGDTNRGI